MWANAKRDMVALPNIGGAPLLNDANFDLHQLLECFAVTLPAHDSRSNSTTMTTTNSTTNSTTSSATTTMTRTIRTTTLSTTATTRRTTSIGLVIILLV